MPKENKRREAAAEDTASVGTETVVNTRIPEEYRSRLEARFKAETEETKTAPKEQPNVRFIGVREKANGRLQYRNAPSEARSGKRVFNDLPDDKTQREGWHYPRAAELIRAFPRDYKPVTEKDGRPRA